MTTGNLLAAIAAAKCYPPIEGVAAADYGGALHVAAAEGLITLAHDYAAPLTLTPAQALALEELLAQARADVDAAPLATSLAPLTDSYLRDCRERLEVVGVDPVEWAERAPSLLGEIDRLRDEVSKWRRASFDGIDNMAEHLGRSQREADALRARVADVERQRDARAADVEVRIERTNRMVRQLEEYGHEVDRLRARVAELETELAIARTVRT